MEPLKCTTETVIKVEYSDLEKFITERTGHSYEIVPNEEWSNDEEHRFVVTGKLVGYQQKDWDAFKSTGVEYQYRLHTILDGLCADGHLAAGIYLISVSW